MTDPLMDPSELGLYLNDPNINEARAEQMIDRAQKLCMTILNPLPPEAVVVIERVAGRGYVSTSSPRARQLEAGGSPYGTAGTQEGGIWLSARDADDLRSLDTGPETDAFTIRMNTAPLVADCRSGWWR